MLWRCNGAIKPRALFGLERTDLDPMCFFMLLYTFSQLLHYPHLFSPSAFTKPKYHKENETGPISHDSFIFMFNVIRNGFLNAALYLLLYCKNAVNGFNVLASGVYFSSSD